MTELNFPLVFPVLQTERTDLIAVRSSERSFIYSLYSDAEVQRYRGVSLFSDIREAEHQIWSWRWMFANQTGIRWGIRHRQAGVLIGTAGLREVSTQHRRAVLSYELVPAWWNRGLMTEALERIILYSLEEMNLHSLEANIDPSHGASRRVLEKLQFRHEAHFRENWYHEGWWDSAIWVKRKS